jgi:phosphatidate cytidylyltransferase
MAATGEARGFSQRLSTIHFGVLLTVYNLSHVAYLTALGPQNDAARPTTGAGLIVCLVALTQMNDVFQYIWGRSFGRRKISPTISPNKTAAGLIGGVLTTSLVAALFGRYLTPLDTIRGAAVGFAIGVAGFLGDLTESALKRDVGVKDTGAVLPGHGGVFDRVDSLTFTAPVFFHLIRMMYFSGGGQ